MKNNIRYIISFLEVIKNALVMDTIDKEVRINNTNYEYSDIDIYNEGVIKNNINLEEVKDLLKGIRKEKNITNFKERIYDLEKKLIIDGFNVKADIYTLSYVVQFFNTIF